MLLCAIGNYLIISRDTIPPLHDANICYTESLRYFRVFASDFSLSDLQVLFSNANFYPPLYMLAPLPLYFIFGPSADVMVMFNLFYLFILLIAVYKIAYFVYDKSAGIFSVAILLTFPAILGFSRITHMNIALTSILALNVYFLLRAENYRKRNFSIWAGITAGIGCLFCSKYIIYFSSVVLTSLIIIFFLQPLNLKKYRKKMFINAIIFLFCVVLISGLFYFLSDSFFNFPEEWKGKEKTYNYKWRTIWQSIINFKFDLFIQNFGSYFRLLKRYILLPNFFLFLISIIFTGKKLQKPNLQIILWGWLFLPLFSFSLLSLADSDLVGVQGRFLVPVLPAVAVLVSGLFFRFVAFAKSYFQRFNRVVIFLGIIIFFVLNYISFFHKYPKPQNSSELLGVRVQSGLLHPVSGAAPVVKLFDFFKKEIVDLPGKVRLIVIFDDCNNTAPLSLELIYAQLRERELNAKLFTPMELSIFSYRKFYSLDENDEFVKDVFQSAEYVLYVSSNIRQKTMGRLEEQHYRNNKKLKEMFFYEKDNAKLIWEYQADSNDFFQENLYLFSFLKSNE